MGLELQDIQLTVPGQILLSGFSLSINDGEIVSLMGASGCGKSTLLSYICGAHSPDIHASGNVLVAGRDVTSEPMERRRIGLLFQDDLLFPHMSVGGNLAFALPAGLSAKERRSRIERALKTAGMAGFEQADPARLSGGQRARISLMRTLLAEPRALLLDEPFSRLDNNLREQIRSFVFSTVKEQNIPTLLVTHDSQDCNGRVVQLTSSQQHGTQHD